MRLKTGGSRAEIPAAPAAGLAVLLVLIVGLTTAGSVERGLVVRLPAGSSRATLPAPAEAVFVTVLPDSTLLLDGEPAAIETLLARIETKTGGSESRPVILEVSDDVPYSFMVGVMDRLAGGGEASGFRVRRLLVPTHFELREWARALGREPSSLAGGERHP